MSAAPTDDAAPRDAVLDVLNPAGKVTKTIPVQFNPASLRLTMSNNVDGGASRGRQVQQYNGSAGTALHVDLEFDTADEGTTADPTDVRTLTAQVAQFVLPGGEGSKQAPPRVQFRWGSIAVKGVMTSLVEELDFFSAEGVPLRAKTTIEIREQDSRFEALKTGSGANGDTDAAVAGEPGGAAGNGPGSTGQNPTGPDARTAEALDGESAADFLARNDQPPQAWRAVAGLVGDALALAAGTSIDFSGSLSLGGGIGISAGFAAGLDLAVGFGAAAGGGIGTAATGSTGIAAAGSALAAVGAAGSGGGADPAAGFALSAAGGVTAALEQARIETSTAAANANRAAFGLPDRPLPAFGSAAMTGSPAVPPSGTGQSPPTARPLPPRADPRATGFGRGVPLRDRVTPDVGLPGTGGYVVIAPYRQVVQPVPAGDDSCGGCSIPAGSRPAGVVFPPMSPSTPSPSASSPYTSSPSSLSPAPSSLSPSSLPTSSPSPSSLSPSSLSPTPTRPLLDPTSGPATTTASPAWSRPRLPGCCW